MAINMSYGNYQFRPVPHYGTLRELLKTESDGQIGRTFTLDFQGVLLSYTPDTSPSGGILSLDILEDELEAGVHIDGLLFLAECDGNVLISGYPRISQPIQFQGTSVNETKFFISKYTFSLEFDDTDDTNGAAGTFDASLTGAAAQAYIESYSEDWQFEFGDKAYFKWTLPGGQVDENQLYTLRVTRNMSAKGRRRYAGNPAAPATQVLTKQPYEQAKAYIEAKLNSAPPQAYIVQNGVLNLGVATSGIYDHIRSVTQSITDGTYSVSESWLVLDSGNDTPQRAAIEDFTVTTRSDLNSALAGVTVEGNIQGLELRNYNGTYSVPPAQTKFENASGYFNTIRARLADRARFAYNALALTGNLNTTALSTTVGYSPANGLVSYSYEFNDRPSNCITGITGLKSEQITIIDNNPTDIFAELTILGRTAGNLLQDMGTRTAASRSVNVELIMTPSSICPSGGGSNTVANLMASSPKAQVNAIIESFYNDLISGYGSVFKSQDSETWQPKNGVYSRSVEWRFNDCN